MGIISPHVQAGLNGDEHKGRRKEDKNREVGKRNQEDGQPIYQPPLECREKQ